MTEQILKISDDFWNIRGDLKIGGLLNVGTHASLVRRSNGKFVLLDAYTLKGEVKAQVDARTQDGAEIEAILNLHPFHTIHVCKAHRQYPDAKLYGTRRHLQKFPELPWESERSNSAEFASLFAEDFDFSVPAGVDFISANEHLHFSSVLAYHRASRTIHSDDTLMYLRLPGLLSKLKTSAVSFHSTLSGTLEKRAGAAGEFREWARGLVESWSDAENLCAAHTAALLARHDPSLSISVEISKALEKAEKTLRKHEAKYG